MSKEITNETEHIRRQLVKDELAAFEQTLLTFDAKSLSRRERQFLTKMAKFQCKPLVVLCVWLSNVQIASRSLLR